MVSAGSSLARGCIIVGVKSSDLTAGCKQRDKYVVWASGRDSLRGFQKIESHEAVPLES